METFKQKSHLKIFLSIVSIALFTSVSAFEKTAIHSISSPNERIENDSVLKVTYIANEGVFITYHGKKVLIDALFTPKNPKYAAPSDELLHQMETAQPLFEHIDLILATHIHTDHFNRDSVIRCLTNNPGAVFLSTVQAVELMKMDPENYTRIEHQVKTSDIEVHESSQVSFNGIEIAIFRTRHSNNNMRDPNFMYLISIDDKKIFHEGDSAVNPETFNQSGLEKESIDIALIHGWFVFESENRKIIDEYLKPAHLVLMHISNDELEGYFDRIDEIKVLYPDVTLFRNSMETRIFR